LSSRPRAARLRALPFGIALLAPSVLLAGCFSAPPQIIELNPAAGSTQLDADATVEVVFDQAVNHQSVATHLSISETAAPSVGLTGCDPEAAFTAPPGSRCWVTWLTAESGFVFHHPGALFAPSTEYTFSLEAGVTASNGNVNSLDHVWNLTGAAAPALTSATPGEGDTVPCDSPIVLSFSRAMSAAAVAAAISLSPPAPGLRVVRNSLDLGQFEIIPDEPLDPSTAYTLTVTRRATDAHGEPILAPIVIHFRTAGLSTSGHLLVLAGPGLGEATEVVLAQLSTPANGLPIPAEILDAAPRCAAAAGCGDAGPGQPTATIDNAALSPGARWLAVVQTDVTLPGAMPLLRVIDLQTGLDQLDLSGATWPAWSPDGSTLAFVARGSVVQLYDPETETLTALHSGSSPSGPPVWTADGDALAIPVGAAGTAPAHVDLANPAISARYALPGISGPASDLVASPQGEEIALAVNGPGRAGSTWVADPSTGQPPIKVGVGITPVGFSDNDTLVVALNAPPGTNQLGGVEIGTGVVIPIPTLGTPDPESAQVAPGGRQIAYITQVSPGGEMAAIANGDGSGALPVTLPGSGLQALSLAFSS